MIGAFCHAVLNSANFVTLTAMRSPSRTTGGSSAGAPTLEAPSTLASVAALMHSGETWTGAASPRECPTIKAIAPHMTTFAIAERSFEYMRIPPWMNATVASTWRVCKRKGGLAVARPRGAVDPREHVVQTMTHTGEQEMRF